MPIATSNIPPMFLPITPAACSSGCGPDQNFVFRVLLKWFAGILTRVKETMARLMKNVPTKINAPNKNPRHEIAVTSSESESNISDANATRFQFEPLIMTAIDLRQSVSLRLRLEAADCQRLPKTRQVRVRRLAPTLVLQSAGRSRQRLSRAALRACFVLRTRGKE